METQIEIDTNADHDLEAVQAVRLGDAERYRELVERHERRVFAVAWNRLGDAALAEEAAQEAFIRGYQRLWLLGDGAKFSAWITAITRHVAINFGLRHRRELDKRQRWALEQTPVLADEATEACPPETLRTALAELPAAHRECLVLFYLEGKNGAEAAAALGISESALRVRLHRAKAALRERLEDRLAESLRQLRPSPGITPNVMAVVLASTSSKLLGGGAVAGIGAKILASLGSTFMFAWLLPLLSLIGALPGMAIASAVARMERKNFRDAAGFRPKLHRRFTRSFLWCYPVLFAGIALLVCWVVSVWGFRAMFIFLALFVAGMLAVSARSLALGRNRFQVGMFIYSAIIAVGLGALALGWLPPEFASLPMLVSTTVLLFVMKDRPARMDYSLFLRATQGMTKISPAIPALPAKNSLDKKTLRQFACFLGERYLAVNFRWKRDGLMLRLAPLVNQFFTNMVGAFVPLFSGNVSHIVLAWDGTVTAHCAPDDAGMLSSLDTTGAVHTQELEAEVAGVVRQAWQEFRDGNIPAAERTLGQVAESEVFVVPPAKSIRWAQVVMGACLALLAAVMAFQFWDSRRPNLVVFPVSISAQDVQAALAELAAPDPVGSNALLQADSEMYVCHVLPREADGFTPAAWQAIRAHLLHDVSSAGTEPADRVDVLMGYPGLQNAVINGWFTVKDLGLTSNDIRAALMSSPEQQRRLWFEPQVYPAMNADQKPAGFSWLDLRDFELRTACLQKLGCLDLVDGRNAVEIIAQQQMLSSASPPGRRQVESSELWHGLFFTSGYNPISQTYESLKVLERFGGLGRIDQKACVAGILRFNYGKGLFASLPGQRVVMFGDARDTFCAFESLRILHALDHVKDLDKWQFQTMSDSEPAPGERIATWDEIEARLCTQRLTRALADHQANSAAPWRSLLEP